MECNQCRGSGRRWAFIPERIGSDRKGQDSDRKKRQTTEEEGAESAFQDQPSWVGAGAHLLLKAESASRAACGNILVHLAIGSAGRIRSIQDAYHFAQKILLLGRCILA